MKEERRKERKNETGRRETKRMKDAFKIVSERFRMRNATRCEILARLAEAGEFFVPPEPCSRYEI